MSFFSIFGMFAFVGAAWLVVLIGLFIADVIWTHGLATTYMHGTSLVLSQIWSFLQSFFTIFQRLIAMAPRALQIFIFFIVGTVIFGILLNWFMAADVVCAGGTPYRGDGMSNVWIAKGLPTSIEEGSSAINVSDIPNCDNPVEVGNCVRKYPNFQDVGICADQKTIDDCMAYDCKWESNVQCNDGVIVNISGTDTAYNVGSSKYTPGLVSLFAGNNLTRSAFIDSNAASFSVIQKKDSTTVVYSCGKNDDVQIGLFGVENLLSLNVLLICMVIGCCVWALKFFGIF